MDDRKEKHILSAEALEVTWKDYPDEGKQNAIDWEERNKSTTKKKSLNHYH